MEFYLSLSLILIILNSVFCSDFNVIELSHELERNSPYFLDPNAEPFSHVILSASYDNGFWLAYGKFTCMEHQGTFVVAPYSLFERGITVDEIPLSDLFGEANVIDISDKVAINHTYELSAQDVEEWVGNNSGFSNNSIVCIYTGWDIIGGYPDQLEYFGDDLGSDFKFPGVSIEAMDRMLSYESAGIRIKAFGTDTPRISNGGAFNYTVGGMCASKNRYGIRNMKDLDQLPTKGARLTVAPMKIKNGAGAPARVFAHLPPF